MKKKIDQFLLTYFYFTRQERKGLFSLLILIVLFQGFIWAYNLMGLRDEPMVVWKEFQLDSSEKNPGTAEESYKWNNKTKHSKLYSIHREKSAFKPWADSLEDDSKYKQKQPLNINHCDSISLVALPKIGPVLASRIISYRTKLGGFYSLNQLNEVYGFREDFLYDLQDRIFLEEGDYKKFNLNLVALEELQQHPYFKFTLSKAIINYRAQHGSYQSALDLKKIRLVNDSIYNLILPYCSF